MLACVHFMIAIRCFTEFNEEVDKFQKSEYPSHIFEAWLLTRHQNNINCCLLIYLLLTFNAPKIYFVGNSFGNQRRANVIVSQKFENYFVILLFEGNVVVIPSDLMIKVVEVYFKKYLSNTCKQNISKLIELYFIHEIFHHKLLHLMYLLIQWH